MESKGGSLNRDEMVVVGNIGAPHGLKGWVRVHSYTEPSDNLFQYSSCYLKVKVNKHSHHQHYPKTDRKNFNNDDINNDINKNITNIKNIKKVIENNMSRENWRKIHFQEYKTHGKFFIATIEGYNTIDAAREITNCEIAILRNELPALAIGQYYWADLEGMTVINEQGKTLGSVHGLLETGANDVLIVRSDKAKNNDINKHSHADKEIERDRINGQDKRNEILIPYVLDDVIKKIDLENRLLTVDWDPEF